MDAVAYFPNEIIQVVWEGSYVDSGKQDPATGFRREVKEVQTGFIFPDQMLQCVGPWSLSLAVKVSGMCVEGRSPGALAGIATGYSLWYPAPHQGEQPRDLPMLASSANLCSQQMAELFPTALEHGNRSPDLWNPLLWLNIHHGTLSLFFPPSWGFMN